MSSQTPKQIVQELLANLHHPEAVKRLCAPQVTYVSLNYDNPDLQKIMPWCGTSHGADAISKTFEAVGRFWIIDSFEPEAIIGDDQNVAVFGRFTYTSTKLKKTVTSPFSLYFKVEDEKITYMQFMEDTFCTSSSFRSGGAWEFQSDPDGGTIVI